MVTHSSPPDGLLGDLIEATALRFPDRVVFQIGPEQGMFMTLLSRLIAPARAIEVGTFTGYSSICLARGLADGGRLICCDVNEDWTSLAQEYWQKAGLADRIELRLGPAIDTLRARSGGIILVDNTLLHGRIFDPNPDPDARAIRDFNEYALADTRVELAMLSIGDGLTFARKK